MPISARQGSNLTQNSDFIEDQSLTLLEALDNLQIPKRLYDRPMRMSVNEVFKVSGIGTVACGRIFVVGAIFASAGVLFTGQVSHLH